MLGVGGATVDVTSVLLMILLVAVTRWLVGAVDRLASGRAS
jgi:hypothetical protein